MATIGTVTNPTEPTWEVEVTDLVPGTNTVTVSDGTDEVEVNVTGPVAATYYPDGEAGTTWYVDVPLAGRIGLITFEAQSSTEESATLDVDFNNISVLVAATAEVSVDCTLVATNYISEDVSASDSLDARQRIVATSTDLVTPNVEVIGKLIVVVSTTESSTPDVGLSISYALAGKAVSEVVSPDSAIEGKASYKSSLIEGAVPQDSLAVRIRAQATISEAITSSDTLVNRHILASPIGGSIGYSDLTTGTNSVSSSEKHVSKHVAANSFTSYKAYFRTNAAQTISTGTLRAIVYANNAGAPGAYLGYATFTSINLKPSTVYWATLNSPIAITKGETYWIGFHVSVGTTLYIANTDTGSVGDGYKSESDTYADGSSNPFGVGEALTQRFAAWVTEDEQVYTSDVLANTQIAIASFNSPTTPDSGIASNARAIANYSEAVATGTGIDSTGALLGIVSEAITASEELNSVRLLAGKGYSEAATLNDSIASSLLTAASYSELVTPNDALAWNKVTSSSYSEEVTSSTQVSQRAIVTGSESEQVVPGDTLQSLYQIPGKSLSELVTLNVSIDSKTIRPASVFESGAPTEVLATNIVVLASTLEAVAPTDGISVLYVQGGQLWDQTLEGPAPALAEVATGQSAIINGRFIRSVPLQ